jgi:LysM repeat protein
MKLFFLSLTFLLSISLMGQSAKFIIRNAGSQPYLEHKVAPKENWYSVGRIYFISPKEIASFNQLSMDKGLGIGQLLKIPLKKENLTQSGLAPAAGSKIVHVVQPKEGLYKLANLYNVDKELLKKMNGLSSDQLNVGYNLIIGFLAPADQSSVMAANSSPEKPATANIAPVKTEEKVLVVEEKPKYAVPETAKDVRVAEQSFAKNPPVAAPVKMVEESAESAKPLSVNTKSGNTSAVKSEKSYFSSLFEQQSKEGKQQKLENSVYGVFKSTSGWQDGKYYVLMNNVIPGTVVKLVRKSTDKVLYAKVLGAVPPGKESEGLTLRMSNAASAALGLGDAGSDVDLVWFN